MPLTLLQPFNLANTESYTFGGITVTANVTGGNIVTGGTVTATGNITTAADVTAQNFNTLSDAVLKTNIAPLSDPQQIINGLLGVEYDWTTGQGHSYGFLAQQVEQVLPNAVRTDSDGMKSVNYTMIIPFLVETIKHMGAEIQELKNQIEKL